MKSARQEILDKLKKTVHPEPEKPDFDSPVYHPIEKPLEEAFKEKLELVNGSVYLSETEEECFKSLKTFLSKFQAENICCAEEKIIQSLTESNIPHAVCKKLPDEIEVGITGCEFLIAHTGSVMVSSAQKGGRQIFIYPPVHVIIAKKSQLVDYLDKAYSGIQKKYNKELPSQIALITGPSRTADIEKTLILGAHGPKELHVFLY